MELRIDTGRGSAPSGNGNGGGSGSGSQREITDAFKYLVSKKRVHRRVRAECRSIK